MPPRYFASTPASWPTFCTASESRRRTSTTWFKRCSWSRTDVAASSRTAALDQPLGSRRSRSAWPRCRAAVVDARASSPIKTPSSTRTAATSIQPAPPRPARRSIESKPRSTASTPSVAPSSSCSNLEGEPCQSIATAFGIPVGTVYSRLHKARKQFKDAHARMSERERLVPRGTAQRDSALAPDRAADRAPVMS